MEGKEEGDVNKEDSEDTKTQKLNDDQEDVAECKPEGRRMLTLRKAIEKTTRGSVAAGRFSLFAKCHFSMAKKKLKALQCIHKQYQEKLREAIKTEVDIMFEEENLPQLMNSLDKVVANGGTTDSDAAWRPTGDPDKDIRAHLIPGKLKTKQYLSRILASVEEQNNGLIKVIGPQRQALHETDLLLQENCNKLTQLTKEVDLKEIDNFIKMEMI